jgi:L-lactate dehydrogenase complex protein LldG
MAVELSARLRENACVVHETDRAGAAAVVVARVAAHAAERTGRVAVAPRDPVVADFELVAALRAHGLDPLVPDDPSWRAELPHAAVGVTGAAVAVTEPAALGIVAAPGVPRATSLLPPVHVCVVRTPDIAGTLGDAFAEFGPRLPSALTWIGGPSRTGDLEMVQTLGVHGPIVVEVVVVDT